MKELKLIYISQCKNIQKAAIITYLVKLNFYLKEPERQNKYAFSLILLGQNPFKILKLGPYFNEN